MDAKKPVRPSGPTPDRVKIEGPWDAAMAKSLKAKKPAEGWPKPPAMPQRAPKAPHKKSKDNK